MSAGKILVAAGLDEKAAPYVEALKAVGVPAERITVLTPGAGRPGLPAERIAAAAGLVLSGGVDVAPERYGESPRPDARLELYPERDDLEWELLAGARERLLPVWCICRGLQLANVFLGGTLWQDLPTQLPGAVPHELADTPDTLAHPVRVAGAGPLAERLSREAVLVNSRHHQAVRDLAPGLQVSALSPDGLVEGFELAGTNGDGDWWLRGVQWHPENLVAMALQRSLWEDFLHAVDGTNGGQR